MRTALGLDLGGTQIKMAVVREDGQVIHQAQTETPTSRGVEEVAERIGDVSREALEKFPEILGIGLGAPGLVDLRRHTVRTAPNFPSWNDVNLGEHLSRRIGRPVILENDVNCFGLAEHRWGAGRSFEHLVALAVGTGIGGAIILNGKLYRGSSGAAAELGHISVDLWGPRCACGNLGCAERYLGEQWFTAAAQAELDDETISSPSDVSARAKAGDERAAKFLEGRGEILGVLCTTLIHTFDPEAIIIGGGIAQAGEPFFRGIRKRIQECAYSILAQRVQIIPARLGTMAGAMGAAAIALEKQ
ncbi:MAG TPA: ROK family protein [bacterium]